MMPQEEDRLGDRIDAVMRDFLAGGIDRLEAEERLIDAGVTPQGAAFHVDRWVPPGWQAS
jgi:hypothetical protein